MRLLHLREHEEDDSERDASVLFGVPSLAIGIVGIVLLPSLLVGKPIGAPGYYEVTLVPVMFTDSMGRKVEGKPTEYMVPSIGFLSAICVGALMGGLGIYLTRADDKNRPARTSASGLIACTVALVLAWLAYARAWW